MYLNCMFYTILWFLISCLLFTAWSFIRDITYCLNHSRHHKGVMVSAWQYIYIYTLVLPIYVLFLCDFTCVVWLMGQLWPFCVNKMTTTTTSPLQRNKHRHTRVGVWNLYLNSVGENNSLGHNKNGGSTTPLSVADTCIYWNTLEVGDVILDRLLF